MRYGVALLSLVVRVLLVLGDLVGAGTPITLVVAGQEVHGMLHLPDCKRAPSVLLLHGFGGTKVGSHRLFVRLAERLRKAGIATGRIDFRGAGDSDGELDEATMQSMCADALAAVGFLQQHPVTAGQPMALLGSSFGATIAVSVAGKGASAAGLVLWAPVFDATPWLHEGHSAPRDVPGQYAVDVGKQTLTFQGKVMSARFVKEFVAFDMSCALQNVSGTPLLHIHASEDTSLGHAHRERYVAACRGRAHSECVVLEADHAFSREAAQEALLQKTTDWLAAVLHGSPEPLLGEPLPGE